MLERLIGEDIQLVSVPNPKTGKIRFDPGQLSQIILNLAVNARDAMPNGGKLTFETSNEVFDPGYLQSHANVIPGAYVMFAVSDTGIGMSADVQSKIFEPFFTTKEVGKGTGLGLATVWGIVKQSGGHIMVYSELGIGTTFKVYLPRIMEKAHATDPGNNSAKFPVGTETILLVEDEEIVRELSTEMLTLCGFKVLAARNGRHALSIYDDYVGPIDLLLTDVVMPEMGGRELAEKFAQSNPSMKVLFTSGYTDDAIVRHGVIEAKTNFIQKPFTASALTWKVRETLDGKPES